MKHTATVQCAGDEAPLVTSDVQSQDNVVGLMSKKCYLFIVATLSPVGTTVG